MKVAFCLSGQMRTWDKCHYSWPLLFERFKEQFYLNDELTFSEYYNEPFEVDYFIHSWNFNTIPHGEWKVNWNEPDPSVRSALLKPFYETHSILDSSEIDLMINKINPKDYLIENWEKSKSRESVMDELATLQTPNKHLIKAHLSWAASQFYSIMMSAHMKKNYEITNKFKYDMCIRSRFDLEFDENNRMLFVRDFQSIKEKTLYSVHSSTLDRFPFDIIGDIFYYCDSETFDLMSFIYDFLPHIDQNTFSDSLKIEEFMAYFVRMFMFDNERLEFSPNVIRKKYV